MAGLAAIEALRAHARDLQPRKRPRPIVAYQGRGQLISDELGPSRLLPGHPIA